MKTLNEQQRKFGREYLKDFNGTQAAIRAGYSKNSAGTQGARLLQHASVQEYMQRLLTRMEEDDILNVGRIINALLNIAELDIGEVYREDGSMKAVHEMPEHIRRAVAGIESEELFDGRGEDRGFVGHTRKLKLGDRTKALELLGKHLKMFTDRVEISAGDELLKLMQEGRDRAKKDD